MFSRRRLGLGLAWLALALTVAGQDPASSADRPAGNVNELTLAGLRPGQTTLDAALQRLGPAWSHPSADERDLYVWCDGSSHLRVQLEVQAGATVQVVTVERAPAASAPCRAHWPAAVARTVAQTGRGLALGATPGRLLAIYGKPFFQGPSSWQGRDVQLIVFNFSWAGDDKPQILESTFEQGKLVKMTLSAQYY